MTDRASPKLRRLWRHTRLRWILLLVALMLAIQAFLSGLSYQGQLPNAVLMLTAHPDDEVMFFAPTILALTAAGVQVYALCLSVGNDEGLGQLRKDELLNSYEKLGVLPSRVKVIDDPQLQDGMRNQWEAIHIASTLGQHLSSIPEPIQAIITFDVSGISYHPNHGACYEGASLIRSVPIYHIETCFILTKFASLPMALLETLFHRHSQTVSSVPQIIHSLSSLSFYTRSLSAMKQHSSQLVWFRYFYLFLSKYMYANTLVLNQIV